jgi:MYND finger
MPTCQRCKYARYCGAACMKAHWRVHKRACSEAKWAREDSYDQSPLPIPLPFLQDALRVRVPQSQLRGQGHKQKHQALWMTWQHGLVLPTEVVHKLQSGLRFLHEHAQSELPQQPCAHVRRASARPTACVACSRTQAGCVRSGRLRSRVHSGPVQALTARGAASRCSGYRCAATNAHTHVMRWLRPQCTLPGHRSWHLQLLVTPYTGHAVPQHDAAACATQVATSAFRCS